MCQTHTTYRDAYALADLPWFALRDGHLTLADDTIEPAIDVHTHLALAYGRPMQLDLWKGHARTEHYLPLERPLELDTYVNRNFSEDDLSRMKRDLTLGSLGAGDMRQTHTAPNLVREMDDLGIGLSIMLPIDLPGISRNAETYLDVADRTERLLSMGSVHPYSADVAGRLATQKARGAKGVKVHPAVQLVAPDDDRAMSLYRVCAELDLPVLWHCGPVGIEPRLGRYLSNLKHYWPAIQANPRTTFILGHSGALQMEMALDLARAYPNVWLEISSQSVGNIERIVREAPPERVMFGSDWPFYHQAIPLAKVLTATEGDAGARRRVLWENAARLFELTREQVFAARVAAG